MINMVKWALNNKCNMKCPFCNVEDSYTKELSFDKKCRALDKMFLEGITTIDFFGKEPLIDDTIFKLMDYCESKDYYFDFMMITNGKNLSKYSKHLLDSPLNYISVSYDFLSTRSFNINLEDLIPFSGRKFIELSIDVQNNTETIIEKLKEIDFLKYGVNSLYFKPIVPFGSLSANVDNTSENSFRNFCYDVLKIDGLPEVYFSIPFEYPKLTRECVGKEHFLTDEKCYAGKEFIYLNSDGKAYGCGLHCSSNRNAELSVDYLATPIGVIEKLYLNNKKRLCR